MEGSHETEALKNLVNQITVEDNNEMEEENRVMNELSQVVVEQQTMLSKEPIRLEPIEE